MLHIFKLFFCRKNLSIFSLGIMCCFSSLTAEVTSSEVCSKELLLSYFPEIIVNDTLQRFNIPSDKWGEIKNSLAQRDKEIVYLVEKKAAQMQPNPLKDPQHRHVALKLFRDTLFEVFKEALTSAGISDEAQIKNMLEDIQQQKAKRFALCLDKALKTDE